MGKGKLAKFADMEQNPLVVQCPFGQLQQEGFASKNSLLSEGRWNGAGRWREDFFKNQNPIVLELGCGRGEYTVGLARRFPEMNFIGVDIKGSRMWHGAQSALAEGLKNVAFLRTNIEFIHAFFATEEVQEIWLTFSDPQMKKATKRLTSTYFLERYRQFLVDRGTIHLKTDSPFLYTYTHLMVEHNHLPIEFATENLYEEEGAALSLPDGLKEIRTYYEQMWLDRGFAIKYLRFLLPKEGILEEPDVDIPVDGYRSYNHEVRSTRITGK